MASSELAFGWDDGQMIAPFVRTDEDALSSVVEALASLPSGPFSPGDVFVDAGCGDGRVPLFVCRHLLTLAAKEAEDEKRTEELQQSANEARHRSCYRILGIDLDDDLVAQANAEATKQQLPRSSSAVSTAPVTIEFYVGDLREKMSDLTAADVVYFYLLPGEQLTELVNCMTSHWQQQQQQQQHQQNEYPHKNDESLNKNSTSKKKLRAILSMKWDVPSLRPFLVGRVGEVWVYDRSVVARDVPVVADAE